MVILLQKGYISQSFSTSFH